MYWRETPASAGGDIDPERELELRLAAQAQAGAAWALSALVARYQPPVVRYLVRLTGNAELAHALAEQVFVRMGKRLRGPQGSQHLRLWLLRAATEVGLDALRRPGRTAPRRLEGPPRPAGLLEEGGSESKMGRLLSSWGVRARAGEPERAAPRTQEFVWQSMASEAEPGGIGQEQMSPQEAIRRRLMRAVLAELPYGDAQCLAMHLVAGLNQSEVASALGVPAPVARRRIVQGLQLFGRRYDAALASLGLQAEPAAEAAPERSELAPFVPAEPIVPAESVVPAVPEEPAGLPAAAPEAGEPTMPLGELAFAGPTAPLSEPDISSPTSPLSAPELAASTHLLFAPDVGGPTAPLGGPARGGPTIPLSAPDLGDETAPLPVLDVSGPTAPLDELELSGPTAPLDQPELVAELSPVLDDYQAEQVMVDASASGEPYVEAVAAVESGVGEAPPGLLEDDETVVILPASEQIPEEPVAAQALEGAAYVSEVALAVDMPSTPEAQAEHAPSAPELMLPVSPAPVRIVPVLARVAEITQPAPEAPAAEAPAEAETEVPAPAVETLAEGTAEAPAEAMPAGAASSEAPLVVVGARVVPVLARVPAVIESPPVRVVPVLAAAQEPPATSGAPSTASPAPPGEAEQDAYGQPVAPPEMAPATAPLLASPAATLDLSGGIATPEEATPASRDVDSPAAAGQDDDVVLVVEAELLSWDDAQEQARRSRMVRVLSADGETEDPGDEETPGAVSGRPS